MAKIFHPLPDMVEFVDDEGRTVAMPSLLPEQITDYIPPE